MRRLAFVLLILLVGGCATSGGPGPDVEQVPQTTVESTLPTPTTTAPPVSTTSTIRVEDTTPIIEGDGETGYVIDRADPVSLVIESVGIEAPISVTSDTQTNACGKVADPCSGQLDLWVDDFRAGVCEIGASFITGHTSMNKQPDAFSPLIDDQEHEFDNGMGVQTGDEVVVELADGTQCHGVVVDLVDGPGQKIEGTPARFFDKLSVQDPNPDTNAATLLTRLAENKSLGFLFTSYCGECGSDDWYEPGEMGDNSWHRRYNAVVMVQWQITPEEG